jgi:hypothetical protein
MSKKVIKGWAIVNQSNQICVAHDSAGQICIFPDEKIADKIMKTTTIKFQAYKIVPVEIKILPTGKSRGSKKRKVKKN